MDELHDKIHEIDTQIEALKHARTSLRSEEIDLFRNNNRYLIGKCYDCGDGWLARIVDVPQVKDFSAHWFPAFFIRRDSSAKPNRPVEIEDMYGAWEDACLPFFTDHAYRIPDVGFGYYEDKPWTEIDRKVFDDRFAECVESMIDAVYHRTWEDKQ